MKHLKYFESKKDKFPDIKKLEVDGYMIQYGRDAKSNDYLTFIVAEDEDIWMHVKGVPGSHVVIRVRENLPTQEILKYAASLAKKNSKANKDNSAKVVYCQRKFVKKDPGMNDGQVKVDYINAEEITI
jgi:predicted ribosome quality control (RQC) complex YloA/Tae2 family protein